MRSGEFVARLNGHASYKACALWRRPVKPGGDP